MIITNIEYDLQTGVVSKINWRHEKEDCFFSGTCNLPSIDPKNAAFTPLNNLTEEQAIQWVLHNMNEEEKKTYEFNLVYLDRPIENKKANGLPWINQ